jgi:diaminopimelate epimerase
VGADGLIFASRSCAPRFAALRAAFYEADGSKAELCGNGTACFVRCALDGRWAKGPEVKVLTPAGMVRGEPVGDGYIRVCIPSPRELKAGLRLEAGGRRWKCDYVVTGVPHALVYLRNVEAAEVGRYGPALRHHRRFRLRGANANFVEVLEEGRLALRTWEFGVEGETLACGTGSAAAAILAARRFRWGSEFRTGRRPVLVRARSGDWLRVYFEEDAGGAARNVCVETVVRFLCAGRLHPDLIGRAWGD